MLNKTTTQTDITLNCKMHFISDKSKNKSKILKIKVNSFLNTEESYDFRVIYFLFKSTSSDKSKGSFGIRLIKIPNDHERLFYLKRNAKLSTEESHIRCIDHSKEKASEIFDSLFRFKVTPSFLEDSILELI